MPDMRIIYPSEWAEIAKIAGILDRFGMAPNPGVDPKDCGPALDCLGGLSVCFDDYLGSDGYEGPIFIIRPDLDWRAKAPFRIIRGEGGALEIV